MSSKKSLEPTSAAAWPMNGKANADIIVELPSGAVAKLRRPPIQYYVATGRVPAKLWESIKKDNGKALEDPLNNMSKDDMRLFIDWMIAAAFVEPPVAMTRKEGAVFIDDLDERDKEEVMGRLGLSLSG